MTRIPLPRRVDTAGMLCIRDEAAFPSDFVEPCLATRGDAVPEGPHCVHEIKHDGCRMIRRGAVIVGAHSPSAEMIGPAAFPRPSLP
jgi:hypothetical protein